MTGNGRIDRNLSIAIIGGGIGGLTAGIALKKAGFAPRIYERAAAFGEVGAGISITPNAVKGLESLGMGEFLTANANEPLEQVQCHGKTGEHLVAFNRRDCRATYGAAYYQLHRADLLAKLVEEFGQENCSMGKSVVSFSDDAEGVTMAFDDDTTATADVMIAADGLRSIVRDTLFASRPPQFSGHVAWRALVPASSLPPLYTAPTNINSIAPGLAAVTYPVRGRKLVNIVALTKSDDWAEEGWSVKAKKSELLARFEGWSDHVVTALNAIPDDAIYRWGLFLREPLDQWVKGRCALLGDAAHPMLPYMGQGASCAIEDAIVLGRCFAAASRPVEALSLYQKARIERGAFLQRESNEGGNRLLALNPYNLRDMPVKNEDALNIFSYDPTSVVIG